ncbi:cyclic nucleotide-gated cation channel subunit A isoform X1 [Drosophila montana]|uniref:cyclic nucleotide-gated cation channel subunit A isoform X1 n=2 Tax=Drosophila montana TaxID=40370 RepID=UPI00313F349F
MWTYMMAAARGDRVNTMMSSRRRPETESPKYGYNLSRPMYRTTRFVGPAASAPAQLPYGSGGGGSSSTSSSCNTAQPLPMAHEELEISGGLYAPFQPTLAAVSMDGVCLPRKHLIANQTAIPMGPDSDELEEQQLHYPRSSCSSSGWLPRQRIELDVNQDDDDDDADDDEDVDDDNDDVEMAAAVGRENGFADARGKDNQEEAIAPADQRSTQPRANDANYLENGRKLIQEPNKRSKPSALRRTLQALRQRLTKRSRAKPPDWFLEKFSNTSNTDKIGKTGAMDDAALSSEIRGSSALCNHLSVDPTLQSHYRWLAVVSLAVLYNIIFVVGRSVFWEINKNAPAVWYTLDYLCDFIYLLDTLVHMHEGFLDQGLLVRDAFRLRRHYFHTKGWYLDVLSMLPTDLAYIWWPPETCSSLYLPCPVIVRLNRLLRLPRLWEWFDRTETATGYPNAFRICKVVLAILVLIHWNACMYFAISYEIGFSSDSWVYNLNGTRNNTLQRQYIYSFYWSTLTLTTIGETPTPENDVEYLFVVADFLAGVLIFATIVGNIGSMISNMNVARVEFQNRMDGVKQYMAFRRVGHELEARVIRWFAYTWSQSGALDEERVLAALPDKLKAEIAIQVHMDTLKQVRIFHDTEPGLLEALVLKLKLQVFSPGDYICRKGDVGKEMYIVKRGKLSVVGDNGVTVLATLGAGSVFGEVSVLEIAGNRTGNRRTANVRSLGYSDLFCLAKRDLWETLADYPEARSTLTQRGCQLLRKDGLLDEQIFADSQRVHDSIEGGIEKLELSVENLNMRLARLLAEYTASQAKIKQRLAKLELNGAAGGSGGREAEPQMRSRSGRLYSLQTKRRPRARLESAAKCGEAAKQNTL